MFEHISTNHCVIRSGLSRDILIIDIELVDRSIVFPSPIYRNF